MAKRPKYHGKFFSKNGNLIHTQDMKGKTQRHTVSLQEGKEHITRHFSLRNWFGRTLIYWEEDRGHDRTNP